MVLSSGASATAQELTLDPVYVRPDGAIMTFTSGNLVDPYFPIKSLLMAHDNGMDITKLALPWINWMLAHQEPDGLFMRYCIKKQPSGEVYEVCGPADADDALLAMWIELLYRMAPKGGMPVNWKLSADKAQYQLDSIFDSKRILFFISKSLQSSLLMDNLEIYSSFKRIEKEAIRIGDSKTGIDYRAKAEYIRNGIVGNFWDNKNKRFVASTQKRDDTSFYPDTVVQLMPMMHKLLIPQITSYNAFYKKWMKYHRDEWFALIGNDYPWGLLAVFAAKRNDIKTSHCWLQMATAYRGSNVWNVLDEVSYQIVEAKLEYKNLDIDPECMEDLGL